MNEDIQQLRNLIRELNLEWLDEELDEILVTGKLKEKEISEVKGRTNKGIERIPYSDQEQLEIIIGSLRSYFVTLPKVQNEADKVISENLRIERTSFIEIENREFQKVSTDSKKLSNLLNEVIK